MAYGFKQVVCVYRKFKERQYQIKPKKQNRQILPYILQSIEFRTFSREINFLHTVSHTQRTLCTKQTANYDIFLFLYRAFSVHRILCVPQYKENELLSFFSQLTIWRDIQKCYMAHLVKMLAYLAQKSQNYFDSFVAPVSKFYVLFQGLWP